jgi:hypothetical protein
LVSDRTGMGPLELAVLDTLAGLGAAAHRPHVKCDRVVRVVEDRFGYGRSYSYRVICNLAQSWKARVMLVDFHGKYGGDHEPPAQPSYTEARLSRVGMLALGAERGEIAPLPVGLINGTLYQDGDRPPFDPLRILDALDRLLNDSELPTRKSSDSSGLRPSLSPARSTVTLPVFFADARCDLCYGRAMSFSSVEASR